jgi:hypothetical protein
MPTTSDLLNWIFNGLQIEVDHMLLAAQLKFCLYSCNGQNIKQTIQCQLCCQLLVYLLKVQHFL